MTQIFIDLLSVDDSKTLFSNILVERKTRFELATLALARRCSTTEPFPQLVEENGFEPLKAAPTDLQSVPFSHSGTLPY